jgi:hypothetical protein
MIKRAERRHYDKEIFDEIQWFLKLVSKLTRWKNLCFLFSQ